MRGDAVFDAYASGMRHCGLAAFMVAQNVSLPAGRARAVED